MTVAEIREMINGMNDNAEVIFVTEGRDRDGWAEDRSANVYKIVEADKVEYKVVNGCYRYAER